MHWENQDFSNHNFENKIMIVERIEGCDFNSSSWTNVKIILNSANDLMANSFKNSKFENVTIICPGDSKERLLHSLCANNFWSKPFRQAKIKIREN